MSISFLIELLRNGGNSAKQQTLMLIFKGFLFTPSYTMWVAPQFFAYWKVPWRYIMLVSFMSIAFVVVQVIFSKVFVAAESWILAVSGWFSKDYSSKLSLICTKISPGMQCKVTHHICYGFWFSPKNSRKLIQKSDFVAHFQRIFVYVLLRPAIYVPIFCQMKGLLKIHNLGKFHYYSYCGCEVINFQNFSYWFSIHEMALFGFFWALIPPNCQILLNFLPEVVF